MQVESIIEIIWAISFSAFILTAVLAIIAVNKQKKKEAQAAVKAYSVYYKKVAELNRGYNFCWDIPENGNIRIYELEKTKAKYDKRRLKDMLYEKIEKIPLTIEQALKDVETNRELFLNYESKLNNLHSEATEQCCRRLKVSYNRFLKAEQELVDGILLHPICALQVQCKKEYISPAGKNVYREAATFFEGDIRNAVAEVKRASEKRNTEEYRRKAERSRVTDKLRYQIMRRDGFRCQLCGASQADGVKLHIDHIIPVSKGGTSDMENLRTLCERCNLGKGDQMENER